MSFPVWLPSPLFLLGKDSGPMFLPGVSVPGPMFLLRGFCPGGSLSGRLPLYNDERRYTSYWNAFLLNIQNRSRNPL